MPHKKFEALRKKRVAHEKALARKGEKRGGRQRGADRIPGQIGIARQRLRPKAGGTRASSRTRRPRK